MGPPVPYPVSSRLIGPDIAELRRLVLPMREIMEAEPTAQSFKTEMGERAPALRLRFDQERLRQIGLSPESVSAQLQTLRSEEHTSELQSLMRISYAVFCLNKKKQQKQNKYILKQQ